MNRSTRKGVGRVVLAATLTTLTAGAAAAQAARVELDTVRAGRFDTGRMWTFEYAPTEYFSQTYGFQATPQWFERARLAALRIPGCSASFVSPNGLVVTNHHCARGAIVNVQRPGENLLDDGFYARSLSEERRIPNYHVDQLIAIEDVSDEVFRALDRATTDEQRVVLRQQAFESIGQRLRRRHAQGGATTRVEIVPLYHGGRYSAYVFRRFTDVRLVVAPELQLGFFGGDPDNFTYPRYALDFAFYRVYDEAGRPVQPSHYFRFSPTGVKEGDAVFVIGNPGPTSRLLSVAQTEFHRDVQVPALVGFLETRLAAMQEFYDHHRAEAEAVNLRNRMFSLSNSLKASSGRLQALNDPVILAKRQDAERAFRQALAAKPELRQRWGQVHERIAELQREKREYARQFGAFARLSDASAEAATLRRALLAAGLLQARQAGAPADTLAAIRQRLLRVGDAPRHLELHLLAARLQDFRRYLGAEDALTRAALQGREPEAAAQALLQASVFADSARTAQALAAGTPPADDPALRLAQLVLPAHAQYQQAFGRLAAREAELNEQLGRARFAAYGTQTPPDATSSPRITDGVVKGYEYNGTDAPYKTTFFGMYDRYHAFGDGTDWDLPPRWETLPAGLDLNTPLNFVSTADTYGGNSGSPAVTKELELVGLNFDRNLEGLSRDYIYLPERGRNIMVDVRAIREALDDVYDADRIVRELNTGRLYETES